MTKYTVKSTTQFKKDYKLAIRRGLKIELLEETGMENYEKRGYLDKEFRVFYLKDTVQREFEYHYHDFNKIIFFYKGKVHYYIEGRAYQLKPYDIVLVNQGEIHKLEVDGRGVYERMIIYIAPEFIQEYANEDYRLSYCFEKAGRERSSVLRISDVEKSRLYDCAGRLRDSLKEEEYADELYRKLLLLEFMVHLNRAAMGEGIEYLETGKCNPKVVGIIEYINQNLTEDLAIDRLAEHFFMSRYHMMRLFKQETGYTIGNYVNQKRLLLARELITGGNPVTQVCYDCGFRNHSTFSRAYKGLFGEPPGRRG